MLAVEPSVRTSPGPAAQRIIDRDAKVVSPSNGREHPFVMAYGRGSEVFDVDGNRYLDFVSGIGVNSTGHVHPHVTAAIHEAVDEFTHISADFYHERWTRLAERLVEIAPFESPGRVFLGNSGTEAVEAAIKLARIHTGRTKFIGFLGGFHGRTLGSLGFTASKTVQRAGYTTVADIVHIPYPNPYRPILATQPGDQDVGETVVNYLEKIVFKNLVSPYDVAAVLVEPIQGEGGYIVPPDSFFPLLREMCDRYGILLIVDEVQSGMGRTGKWWAIEHWGVQPDIVCTAKGIASGMPLGGIIAREAIMTWGPGSHGNTYGGNPVSCAAALATLDVLQAGVLENARVQGEYMMEQMQFLAEQHECIGEVRGKGLMIGVEFVQNAEMKAPNSHLRERIKQLAFEKGLLLIGCGESALRFIPPLVITQQEIDEGVSIFAEALIEAEQEI